MEARYECRLLRPTNYMHAIRITSCDLHKKFYTGRSSNCCDDKIKHIYVINFLLRYVRKIRNLHKKFTK